MAKKVLSFQQNHEGVMLRFSDNSTLHGDVLVGADGAHSSIRQHLYKTLDKQGLLPKSDTKHMNKGYISLVGTTDALDPEKYPSLNLPEAENSFIIGDGKTPYTWVTFTVPGNKICWCVIVQLGLTAIADEQFRSSDWVPQQNKKMMDSIRHFKTTYGTMGDLFDATPTELVSKLLPSSGAGAVNAMQDAVILANCLFDIRPTSFENIKAALRDYRDERFDPIKEQYPVSHISAKLQYGHTFAERVFRYFIFNWLSTAKVGSQFVKDSAYRPQANFLPQAPKRGTADVLPQRPSKRLQEEDEKKAAVV
ncbi:hypothetical protein BG015_005109 [Linnemannia schmuckeri]|uniref:FAD-binding domain-containing protein n=1 Tax=Linnemannia schmuckeri TaxID=64567 RepID=A0A9P5UXN1_9FUNG|nr:hypothetical protein BG015_005109 [Linnemannia schmuckeri]